MPRDVNNRWSFTGTQRVGSPVKIRTTEGFLTILPGDNTRLQCFISVQDVNAPELPPMQVLDNTGWYYYETTWHPGQTTYVFHLENSSSHMLDMMVMFFDILYGVP